ncbi:toprim domain-containing protein [Crenobacter sp. SG2305]|uniref:DUF7146 domain-containing protein n=1 Tax=Crenobacter oryzisoli TaxID=3056844 RepID=UPI0025AA6B87|nr:toprim domain-containing protein [Crenobacter sp. SG2305]MDN0082500.1 toprim domain-containing protein [Crenobacter sp. SG2305]
MQQLVDIKDLARGRWPELLVSFGINQSFLDGKHHACPCCEGKDRFRFDDKTGDGNWVCSGHGMKRGSSVGAGNGIDLLMGYLGKSFREVADMVREALTGNLPRVERPVAQVKQPVERQDVLRKLNRLRAQSRPAHNGPVQQYLLYRGLQYSAPDSIRYLPSHGYYIPGDDGPVLVGNFPVMIADVVDVEENLLAVHRTYLDLKGQGKAEVGSPRKLSNKGIGGGAIRLFKPVDGFIAITEGIETALAVNELYGWPVWATIATTFMRQVVLPKEIDRVVICADFDPINPNTGTRPGHEAALALRDRLRAEGRQVKVIFPPREGMDFLDVLVERNANES